MIARLGSRISSLFEKTAPDPFTLAVLLTIATAILAITLGNFDGGTGAALDTWRGGLWNLLAFAMQMCLILATGHALASSTPVRRMIASIASMPTTPRRAVGLVAIVAVATGLINWGLGLIVGALLAHEVGRSMSKRGVRVHYPLLAAGGYAGLAVWHGGLSGSAPLTVSTEAGMAGVLSPETIDAIGENAIPLGSTLFSPLNAIVSGGMLVLIPVVFMLLTPTDPSDARPIEEVAPDCLEDTAPEPLARPATIPEWLERTPWLAWLLALAFLIAAGRFVLATDADRAITDNLQRLGLNEVTLVMLGLGLIAHGSLAAYGRAMEDAARGCAGIILQFPLYAGIAAMLGASGLIAQAATALEAADGTALTLLVFASAGVVNFFVPSGGGQFTVQGDLILQAGLAAGVEPGKLILAFAYGDQLTNLLQPFWALPLLAITRCKAREIVGYTAVVLVACAAWCAIGLAVL
ncbi:MAG: TIGR00366 family protein [Planctomycetota bacterium]